MRYVNVLLLVTLVLGGLRWLVPSAAIDWAFVASSVLFVLAFVIAKFRT